MKRTNRNVFDAAMLFVATIVCVLMGAMMGACQYAAETKVTPAESSVKNKVSQYRLEVSRAPQAALCQSTVVKQPAPQPQWSVKWTAPAETSTPAKP